MTHLTTHPFIQVDGAINFRDIGGLSTPTGIVRRNCIFRSGRLNELTPQGAKTIRDLGITRIFELRMAGEPLDERSLLTAQEIGIEKINVPVVPYLHFKDHLAKRKAYALGPEGYEQEYLKILMNAGPALAIVFSHIRDRPMEACLIHCSLGRDRTGVVIALILDLAGVSQGDILDEYQLSEQGLACWMAGLAHIVTTDDPNLKSDPDALNNVLRVRLVAPFVDFLRKSTDPCLDRKDNLKGTLDTIRKRYGGAEGYLRERCGFTEKDVQFIRANLVEEPSMFASG